MKRLWWAVWLLPVALAAAFWWFPPLGDDAYYHPVSAAEHVRAWREGVISPPYHRGKNGGTGSFAPTVFAPILIAIQHGLAEARLRNSKGVQGISAIETSPGSVRSYRAPPS